MNLMIIATKYEKTNKIKQNFHNHISLFFTRSNDLLFYGLMYKNNIQWNNYNKQWCPNQMAGHYLSMVIGAVCSYSNADHVLLRDNTFHPRLGEISKRSCSLWHPAWVTAHRWNVRFYEYRTNGDLMNNLFMRD